MISDTELARSLIDRGLADENTLQAGREYQKKNDHSLYEALSLGKFVDDGSLVDLASHLLNVPAVRLKAKDIERSIVQLVPSSMAFRNRVVPIEIESDKLVLGMIDPVDVLAMDEVAMHTGINITPVLVSPKEMNAALDTYYAGRDELHSLDEGLLDSISALDVDSMVDDVISDESWVGFFEDDRESAEELSQMMRERPTTGVLDIDSEEIDAVDEDVEDLLAGLDRPPSAETTDDALKDWEVDDAIDEGGILGGESSFILSKDSAEELFKQDSTKNNPVLLESESEAENNETKLGIIDFSTNQGTDAGASTLKGDFERSIETNVGVGSLNYDAHIQKSKQSLRDTPTSEVPAVTIDEINRERDETPISSLAIERSDPATKEITKETLLSMQNLNEQSSLEEETAAAEEQVEKVERISSLMKGFRRNLDTVESTAATPAHVKGARQTDQHTKPKSLVSLAKSVQLDIPEDVTDRMLLETIARVLVAQGIVESETLMKLLQESEAEEDD